MLNPKELVSHFRGITIDAQLGEGGQKWVYAATHSADGPVVLKIIKPAQNAERVRREVLAVQKVNSRRVPQVLDVGTVSLPIGECIWLREQRIFGSPVRQLLESGPLSATDTLVLGTHVLEALSDIERERIVHRDVKPDNIMRDGEGGFWLLDFGIARHLDLESLTATAALGGPGTLGYAPPEQYRNRKRAVDGRADLFALGVTLWECASGSHPFRDGARDISEIYRRIETAPLPSINIPWDHQHQLTEFVLTMMRRRADHRPASATEALEWMRSIANDLSA